jgi:hypothetical protein
MLLNIPQGVVESAACVLDGVETYLKAKTLQNRLYGIPWMLRAT